MTASPAWRALAQSLIGDPVLTGPEVALQAGIDFPQARRLWGALGFPPVPDDARVFTPSDVAVLRAIRALLDEQTGDPAALLQLTRVTGQSLARVAEAHVASRADLFALLHPDAANVDVIASRVGALAPQLESIFAYVWRRHLLAAVLRFAATTGVGSGADRTVVVGFADLVGFTAISQQLSEHELAAMVDRFETLAYEHILAWGGRVVKMIGDEVMFSVETAHAAAEIALALVDAYAEDGALPDVRTGLAIGPTLSWEGDLFGPTVNLASRLVNIARPGTVLVAEDLGHALREAPWFTLRHLRPLPLKGIGSVRTWVLRRTTTPSDDPSEPPRQRRQDRRQPRKERNHARP